jgi:hypothetical protein
MSDDFVVDPPPKPSRGIALALALSAAALLLGASFTRKWLVNSGRGADIGIGLHSMYMCADGGRLAMSGFSGESTCIDQSNSTFVQMIKDASRYSHEDGPSSAFVPAGWVTFGLLLIAAVALLGAAAFLHLQRPAPLPMAPTSAALLALMVALISGCVFVGTKPGPAGGVGVGLSFWMFGVGSVLGIAGAQMIAKINRLDAGD